MKLEDYVMKKVKEFAATEKGKEKIKNKYGKVYDPDFNENKAIAIANDLKNILYKKISIVIPSIKPADIIVNKITLKDGGSISFVEENLKRDSLIRDWYVENPDEWKYESEPGVLENIILLFSRGYSASKHVYGYWYGHSYAYYYGNVKSIKSREPNNFLQEAVNEFNKKYEGIAIAKVQGKYAE